MRLAVHRPRSGNIIFLPGNIYENGDRGGTVVKVLCYKLEGHWFNSSWCQWDFLLT